jgi:hypothetical protein
VPPKSLTCVYSDGLLVFGPAGPPLAAARSGANIVLYWPASAQGYELWATADALASGWNKVNVAPVEIGGQQIVTVPLSGAQKYFRLQRQSRCVTTLFTHPVPTAIELTKPYLFTKKQEKTAETEVFQSLRHNNGTVLGHYSVNICEGGKDRFGPKFMPLFSLLPPVQTAWTRLRPLVRFLIVILILLVISESPKR